MKRAPCRARFPAHSRPEPVGSGPRRLPRRCSLPVFRQSCAVRSRRCRSHPALRHDPEHRMRPSSSRRMRLPSLLRAGHRFLLPRAVFFRTPWVADTARYRPRLASQPARVSPHRAFPCGKDLLAKAASLARGLGRPGSSSGRQVGTWRHDAVTSWTDVPRSLRTPSLARWCRALRSHPCGCLSEEPYDLVGSAWNRVCPER